MELFDDFIQDAPEALPPIIPGALNMEPARVRLERFRLIAEDMKVTAEALVVNDPESMKKAVSLAGTAKKKWNEIETDRKALVAGPNDFIKSVNGLAKDVGGPLQETERILKGKISTYDARLRIEAQKAQKAAEEEALKLQRELDKEAAEAGVEAPIVLAPAFPVRPAPVRTEDGSVSMRKLWQFEVLDPLQVPREYLIVDEKKIREAVKAGVREIAGVRIFEDYTTTLRV